MVELAASFPQADFSWRGFGVVVLWSRMQPVSIWIDMELLKVSELVHGVMLQVMCFNHLTFCWLGLIREPIES